MHVLQRLEVRVMSKRGLRMHVQVQEETRQVWNHGRQMKRVFQGRGATNSIK